MRSERSITLSRMATDLGVSPAYLSALEHGRRGVPTFATIQAIIGYFNVIWDDAEELQRLADLSHPRIVVDTSGLDPKATAAANRLARLIHRFDGEQLERLHGLLDEADRPDRRR